MEEHGDWTSGVCPGASVHGETVSLYVPYDHPLRRLQRAWPWETLAEVMTRYWRQAGKNVDGHPGLAWDVALYVPLVVWMVGQNLQARDMEAYLAENVVARVCSGGQDNPRLPLRDHSPIARAYAALGKDGIEEGKALRLHGARDCGCADVSRLSADTTAQELPIG